MAIDIQTRKPKIANINGGLSGPAIKPVALRMVWETARKVHIPVIGIGGIMTAEDALEFLIAGAKAVQVASSLYKNGPEYIQTMLDSVQAWMQKKGHQRLEDFRGKMSQEASSNPAAYERVQFMKYYS